SPSSRRVADASSISINLHKVMNNKQAAPTLVLAPGAGAGSTHPWMVAVAKALEKRAIHVVTFDFPYRTAGKSMPDPPPVLERTWAEKWGEVAAKARGPLFAGGKSMGGRIASQVAALQDGFHPMPAG